MRDLRHKIPREVWSLEMIADEVIDTILGSDREREDYDDWKQENNIEDGSPETLNHIYGLCLFYASEVK